MTTYTEEQRQSAIRAILRQREYMRQYNRRYNQEHGEAKAECDRLWREEHTEKAAECSRRWHEEHREEAAALMRRWHQEHKERTAEYMRQWYLEHPEARARYRRKRLALTDGDFTAEEFMLLCRVYENRCAYCHQKLPLIPDHAAPLSRGGGNTIENIVPACASCNQRKCAMTYDEFVERLALESELRR